MIHKSERDKAYEYTNFISVAYECISLLKDVKNAPHVVHIASSMYNACRSLFPDTLASMFYDLIELAEYASDEVTLELVPRSKQALRKTLKQLTDESVINPTVSGDEQTLLDEKCMPIHVRMMNNPNDVPTLFIELVGVLDTLVENGTLSAWAAGREVGFAINRPQIIADKRFTKALQLAEGLELPGVFRKGDPVVAWKTFASEVAGVSR